MSPAPRNGHASFTRRSPGCCLPAADARHGPGMGKRTAWIYTGLPHTGGPAVAEVAYAHGDALAAHGIGLPASSPEQMHRAATELMRDHRDQGLRRRDVEGAWADVCRRAWRDKRACLVGDERLAAADADQVALLLDGLAGLRPRAVLALRDPSALLVEGWVAEVREGRATTLERYTERVLDPDREHAQAQRFRAAHDVAGLLDRWTAALGPDRVHVVVLPRDRDPAAALWAQLLGLLGVDAEPSLLELPPPAGREAGAEVRPADPTASAAGLREVNAALKGRLTREARRDLLRTWLPPVSAGDPPPLPREMRTELTVMAEKWRARVAESGVPVLGDLDELVPTERAGEGQDGASAGEALSLTARALGEAAHEVADLRGHVATLERRNAKLERKRTKLKRRLAHLGA